MDGNKTVVALREALYSQGLRGVLSVFIDQGFTNVLVLLEQIAAQPPILAYLRSHVTAWDVFAYLITSMPALLRAGDAYVDAPEPLIFAPDGSLLTEGYRWEARPEHKYEFITIDGYLLAGYTCVLPRPGGFVIEHIVHGALVSF